MWTLSPIAIVLMAVFLQQSFCADTVKIEITSRPKDCKQKANPGDKIAMHYNGVLSTGKPFDSSYSRKSPFKFQLGIGQVIPCWDQGVPNMCVGEKRKLTCPPEYAYGDKGFGDVIPAKSTLVFDIELMEIEPQTEEEKKATQTKLKEAQERVKKEQEQKLKEASEEEHQHPDSFESVDKDGNGEISRDEMFAYIKSYQDEDSEGQGEKPSDEDLHTLVGDIFQSDDKNKDGSLNKEEYDHAGDMEGGIEDDMKTDHDEHSEDIGKDEL